MRTAAKTAARKQRLLSSASLTMLHVSQREAAAVACRVTQRRGVWPKLVRIGQFPSSRLDFRHELVSGREVDRSCVLDHA
jgi:hypothetical protein